MAVLSQGSRGLRHARSVLALACLSLAGTEAAAQGGPDELERQVKAAYLLNFTRYVSWPPASFAEASDPMNLCVVGPAGFDLIVRRTVEGRRSRGRPVRVVVPDTPEQAADCHVAYLAPEHGPMGPWLAALRGAPVLTVGDGDRFLARGGMIAFVLVGETVHFAIDAAAAHRAGLEISSRVLALAVRRAGPEKPR